MPRSRASILIVDDQPAMAAILAESLVEDGYDTNVVYGGADAIERLSSFSFDVVITDLVMPSVDGFEVLRAATRCEHAPAVIVMTAFGAIETAIEAMRLGAAHYLVKPCKLDELKLAVAKGAEERRLRRENQRLRRVAGDRLGNALLLGQSPPMRSLCAAIERVAQSPAPVLLRAESGTGKELVARALHEEGPRRVQSFVAVNCTAIPDQLLESELFGHMRGAFTGATTPRRGLFVEADGGTLFLDEIGDMPAALQGKLLRAIEEGEVRAVGADQPRQVDVRIIAATHQNLEEMVSRGAFRKDLFYRINVVPLTIPPLRERLSDIPLLVARFLLTARQRNPSSPVLHFSPALINRLACHSWPGNVRELENLVERLVVMGAREVCELDDLATSGVTIAANPVLEKSRRELPSLRQVTADYIAWVIESCEGNKTRAAEILGVDVSTLHRRERQGS